MEEMREEKHQENESKVKRTGGGRLPARVWKVK